MQKEKTYQSILSSAFIVLLLVFQVAWQSFGSIQTPRKFQAHSIQSKKEKVELHVSSSSSTLISIVQESVPYFVVDFSISSLWKIVFLDDSILGDRLTSAETGGRLSSFLAQILYPKHYFW